MCHQLAESYLFIFVANKSQVSGLTVIDDVLRYIATNEIRWLDLQFFDISGNMHRVSVSNKKVEESMFAKGVKAAELSQVFGNTDQGELVLLPDANTLARIPWEPSSIRLFCDVTTAVKKERYMKDPRYVADRMETNLSAAGIKDSRVSSHVECHILDNVSSDRTAEGRGSGTLLDSREAKWSPSPLSNWDNGAFLSTPYDSMYSARNQICETMEDSFGVNMDGHSHGKSPTAQQAFELGERSLKDAADAITTLKFVVRNLANAVNGSATFMPYPIEGEVGNSQHISLSLWKAADNNVFYDGKDSYAQLSQTGRYFIGGVLEHAAALSLFTAPSTNSYKKLAMEPLSVGWSSTDPNALMYVPFDRKNDKESKRIVYKGGDPSANTYLAYGTLVAAGLDGMKNKIDPGDAVESGSKKKRVQKTLPTSLYEAVEALESDTKFIKGLIPSELLGDYLDLKIAEHKKSTKALTGWEIAKYFNV